MLDRTQHEINLKRILRDIYANPNLNSLLGFKGGTCLYFFYDLARFSTDLDFNLLGQEKFQPDLISKILEKYLRIDQFYEKRFTYFWLASFDKGKQRVKIEINKRNYPDQYDIKNFYGLSIKTMQIEYMFAHKLCAITDRRKIVNRDIFDAHFFFKNNYEINEDIIKLRTNLDLKAYLSDLIIYLKKNLKTKYILEGLGEVLDQCQKDWVRDHLWPELLFELEIRVSK